MKILFTFVAQKLHVAVQEIIEDPLGLFERGSVDELFVVFTDLNFNPANEPKRLEFLLVEVVHDVYLFDQGASPVEHHCQLCVQHQVVHHLDEVAQPAQVRFYGRLLGLGHLLVALVANQKRCAVLRSVEGFSGQLNLDL